MVEKKEKKKKIEPTLKNKVDTIYEILSQHKIDIEYLGSKIEDVSSNVDKVKGRMGI